jgi:hypothetical protein
MKTFYVIPNTCDCNRLTELGEMCVVLDESKEPIWAANHNDFPVDLSEAIPWSLLEKLNKFKKLIVMETEDYIEMQINKDVFEYIDEVPKKLADKIVKFIENEGLI